MKPPKNFYSNLDRRKQGLPELPEASASDSGKIVKVGDDGDYELGEDGGSNIPPITASNSRSILQVTSQGTWALRSMGYMRNVIAGSDGSLTSIKSICAKIVQTDSINRYIYSVFRTWTQFTSDSEVGMPINIVMDTINYIGIIESISSTSVSSIVSDSNGNRFVVVSTENDNTFTPIGSVKYYEITSSGSSVSLPSGVTFADVYAELQAGVDVKFTSGARVYSVTSFESTNIRAHWMSDLDLTSMEVYVINLASDGTGTVASATFSGS